MTTCTCGASIFGDPKACPMCHKYLGGSDAFSYTTPQGHYTKPATRAERIDDMSQTTQRDPLHQHDPTNQSSPDADWLDDPGPSEDKQAPHDSVADILTVLQHLSLEQQKDAIERALFVVEERIAVGLTEDDQLTEEQQCRILSEDSLRQGGRTITPADLDAPTRRLLKDIRECKP